MCQIEVDIAEFLINNKDELKLACYPRVENAIEAQRLGINLQEFIEDEMLSNLKNKLTMFDFETLHLTISKEFVIKVLGQDWFV